MFSFIQSIAKVYEKVLERSIKLIDVPEYLKLLTVQRL